MLGVADAKIDMAHVGAFGIDNAEMIGRNKMA